MGYEMNDLALKRLEATVIRHHFLMGLGLLIPMYLFSVQQANAQATHTLKPTPKTVAWGYYDAKAAAKTVASGYYYAQ